LIEAAKKLIIAIPKAISNDVMMFGLKVIVLIFKVYDTIPVSRTGVFVERFFLFTVG
jgi:hypothetical protein